MYFRSCFWAYFRPCFAELKSGDYFGEMALLDDETRKASVIAISDIKCFNIDRPTFNRLLGSLHHVMARETAARMETLRETTGGASSAVQQLNLNFSDLATLAVLGSGTFGRVTLVQEKSSKKVGAGWRIIQLCQMMAL